MQRVPAPASRRPAASSVFAANSGVRVTATEACPCCGSEVEYRPDQLGSQLACPRCADSSFTAGGRLSSGAESAGQAVIGKSLFVLIPKRIRWNAALQTVATLLIAAAAVGMAFKFVVHSKAIDGNWEAPSVAAVAAKDPAGVRTADGDGAPLPPPIVTLAMIHQLRDWPEAAKALVQAHVWLRMLSDHEIADDRVALLEEVIAELEDATRPAAAVPPQHLQRFRRLLATARRELAAERLAAAAKAVDQAERLLNDHPEDLTPFARSFLALKQQLQVLRQRVEGKQRILDALASAEQKLRSERPTEAAEAVAEALFRALGTPLDDDLFQQLQQRVKAARRQLRLEQGKRAVRNAAASHAAGDLQSRDRLLSVALELLPDLPAEQVADLMKRARELAEKPIDSPQQTDQGKRFAARDAYELALELYGQPDALLELVRQCDVAAQRQPSGESELSSKLESLVVKRAEFELFSLLNLSASGGRSPAKLARLKQALSEAERWSDSGSLQRIRQAVTSKEDEVAEAAVRQAMARAADGQLAGLRAALDLVTPALTIGSPDSIRRARELHDRLSLDVQRLMTEQRQDEAWEELAQLSDGERYIEAWVGLGRFETEFPDSPYHHKIPGVREKLRPLLRERAAELYSLALYHHRQKEWSEFQKAADELLQAPADSEQREALDWVRDTAANLAARAERLFEQSKPHRKMQNEEQIRELLVLMREVLEIDPHHKQAVKLFTEATERANGIAEGYLLRARKVGPKAPAVCKRLLTKTLAIAPPGPIADEARGLLKELE